MITTLVAIAVYGAFALKEAHEDRKGKPVDAHAPDWVDRAVFAFVVAVCCAYANIYTTDATVWGFLWKLVGFCLIAYGLFSMVFRWRLNRLRGMDARYVSPWSNVYDAVFLVAANLNNSGDERKWNIRRAGLIAYAVEGLAFIGGCGITLAH